MKIDTETHSMILAWGKAHHEGLEDTAVALRNIVAQRLSELRITSREVAEEGVHQADHLKSRWQGGDFVQAALGLGRSYVLARDLVALGEDRIDPVEGLYRHSPDSLRSPIPALAAVPDVEQPQAEAGEAA